MCKAEPTNTSSGTVACSMSIPGISTMSSDSVITPSPCLPQPQPQPPKPCTTGSYSEVSGRALASHQIINPTSVTKDLCGFLGLFRDYALFGKECSLGDGVQHAMQVNNTGFCGAWSRLEVYRKTGLRSTCNMVNA